MLGISKALLWLSRLASDCEEWWNTKRRWRDVRAGRTTSGGRNGKA